MTEGKSPEKFKNFSEWYDKVLLEADIASLESSVSGLEDDLAAARSSASTMQMYAIAALIVGFVVGVFIGPMFRKS